MRERSIERLILGVGFVLAVGLLFVFLIQSNDTAQADHCDEFDPYCYHTPTPTPRPTATPQPTPTRHPCYPDPPDCHDPATPTNTPTPEPTRDPCYPDPPDCHDPNTPTNTPVPPTATKTNTPRPTRPPPRYAYAYRNAPSVLPGPAELPRPKYAYTYTHANQYPCDT